MIRATIPFLSCVRQKKCKGALALEGAVNELHTGLGRDIEYGILKCKSCHAEFPILAGVAILVSDVRAYLMFHVKGISKFVPDTKIPKPYRADFLRAKKEIFEELTEEDLESDRVNALYLMNHYLEVKNTKEKWWKPLTGVGSPEVENLVEKYWDHGPLSVVAKMMNELANFSAPKNPSFSVVELGCGVGGLFRKLNPSIKTFIGLDSSFQSIILARHFNLGIAHSGNLKIPADLLSGAVSRDVTYLKPKVDGRQHLDFVVGEIDRVPLKMASWDAVISMNTIDMLDDPRILPETQNALLKAGGHAIQSDPYIWHEKIAKRIRSGLPKTVQDSAGAVRLLYEKVGFKTKAAQDHVPWVFFKHLRQVELYSVHAFLAEKLK